MIEIFWPKIRDRGDTSNVENVETLKKPNVSPLLLNLLLYRNETFSKIFHTEHVCKQLSYFHFFSRLEQFSARIRTLVI